MCSSFTSRTQSAVETFFWGSRNARTAVDEYAHAERIGQRLRDLGREANDIVVQVAAVCIQHRKLVRGGADDTRMAVADVADIVDAIEVASAVSIVKILALPRRELDRSGLARRVVRFEGGREVLGA